MAACNRFLCLVWNVFLPCAGLYIAYQAFGRYIHRNIYAFCLARVAVSHNKFVGKRKKKLFEDMHGDATRLNRPLRVLEVGAGAGANFKFFPNGSEVVCVDPNPHFDSYLKKNAHEFPHVKLTDFVIGTAEDMNLVADDSMDVVVCTLVFCSVGDVDQSLQEIRRILKPGGKFYYMEHTRAEKDSWTWTSQWILNPLWKFIGLGCHVTRDAWLNIDKAGFSDVEYEHFQMNAKEGALSWLPILEPHLMGQATK